MVLDPKVKVPAVMEIAEPAVRKGRVLGRGTAGQRRKRLLAMIAADKKKNIKKSRTLSIEGPGGRGNTMPSLPDFIFHTNAHRSCVP